MADHWAWTAKMPENVEDIYEQALQIPQLAEVHAEERIPLSLRRWGYQLKQPLLQHEKPSADIDEASEDGPDYSGLQELPTHCSPTRSTFCYNYWHT